MKTFTRWLLALLLVATPIMAAVDSAQANTELTPASRLVAPYVDIQTSLGRSTFFLVANPTGVNLLGGASATSVGAVHIQFYSKTCSRQDTFLRLSPRDIDQLNVTPGNASVLLPDGVGFADINVRGGGAAGGFGELENSDGIQENALIGEVVITDTGADFALSYPMASSLGSSTTGAGGFIVRRNPTGAANFWLGRYEPFPTRIMLPGFYAEGGTGAGAILTSLLAVASPADGEWYGFSPAIGVDVGEAPGGDLSVPGGSNLIDAEITVWDGCEQSRSFPKKAHYLVGSLTSLFGSDLNRSAWGACPNSLGTLAVDELSGVPVGWIDISNTSCARADNDAFGVTAVATANCTSGTPTLSLAKRRGLVGVFFESTNVTATTKGADVARLWGDFTTITNQTGCLTTLGASAPCSYSFATGAVPNNVTLP